MSKQMAQADADPQEPTRAAHKMFGATDETSKLYPSDHAAKVGRCLIAHVQTAHGQRDFVAKIYIEHPTTKKS